MKNSWGHGARNLHLSAYLKDTAASAVHTVKTCLATPEDNPNRFDDKAGLRKILARCCAAGGTPAAIVLAMVACCMAVPAWAQTPANDDFTTPFFLTGAVGSTNGSNIGAPEGEPTPVTNSDIPSPVDVTNTVWFQWTATNSGYVTFDTVGSTDQFGNVMDTVLAAWTGVRVGRLTLQAADNDIEDDFNNGTYPVFATNDNNSSITFYATANTPYSISVDLNADDQNAQPGTYFLNWNALQPSNGVFTNATPITGSTGSLSGLNFNAIGNTFIATNLFFNGTNGPNGTYPAGVTNSPYLTNQVYITDPNDLNYYYYNHAEPIDVSNSVWFEWTATNNGMATFDTIGSADLIGNPMDTVLTVWTNNSSTNLVPVLSDDDTYDDFGGMFDDPNSSVTFPALAGTNYYISVSLDADDGGQPGNYVLNWNVQTPANDNLAKAITLTGTTGTTNGININATMQTNEQAVVTTDDSGYSTPVDVGNSIWYQWTPSVNGNVTFNTFGSVDELGNPMDTVLAVWTGNNISKLTFVGANDNYVTNGAGTNLNSTITFYASAGTTYDIAVYANEDSGLPGNIVLNWDGSQNEMAASAAGTFQFTSAQYQYSQNENNGARHSGMTEVEARATVTRIGGADGMVDVGYRVGSTLYTNWIKEIIYQTNIYAAIYSTNMPSAPGSLGSLTYNGTLYYNIGISNFISTLTNFTLVYQDYSAGEGYYDITNPLSGAGSIWGSYYGESLLTNIDGFQIGQGYYTNDLQPYLTNLPVILGTGGTYTGTYVTNSTPFSYSINDTNELWATDNVLPYDVTNSDGTLSFFTNSINYTNLIVTNIVPSTGNLPVSQSGTLRFDDFQMNADISVPFETAYATTNFINPLVNVTLTGVQLDPSEDPSLPAPQLSPTRSISSVSFWNTGAAFFGVTNTTLGGLDNIFNFERSTLRVDKTEGMAYVGVTCLNHGDSGTATVYYRIDFGNSSDNNNEFTTQAGSDYARPDNANLYTATADFTSSTESPGELSFPPDAGNNSVIQYIAIPITQDNLAKFNQDINIQLYYPPEVTPSSMDGTIGLVNQCTLTILLTTQPAGAVDTAWNPEQNEYSSPPEAAILGANEQVNAVVVQTNGQAIIGGDFTSYSSSSGGQQNYIARLNTDGSLDTTFDSVGGAYGGGFGGSSPTFVQALALDANQNIIAVGQFKSYNNLQNSPACIARLLPTGAPDPAFDNAGYGANGTIDAVALQTNGQILIAGDFTAYNGTNYNHIARLNTDGSLDLSFNPGTGPNADIYSIGVQTNGAIVIGGAFTEVDNTGFNFIARLNYNGTLDTTFSNLTIGANNVINAVAIQPNGEILVGGAFTSMEGDTNISYLTALNPDGSLNSSFTDGTGPNNTVNCITLNTAANDGTFFIGGYFTSVNQTRRFGIARMLPNGWLDTSFLDMAYNQFAGFVNSFYSNDPLFDNGLDQPNPIFGIALESVTPTEYQAQTYDLIVGGLFSEVGGPGGLPNGHYTTAFNREELPHPRENVARLIGGATPGPGNIQLYQNSYSANNSSGNFFIQMDRTNGNLGPVTVTVKPVQTGSGVGYAAPGTDYVFNATAYSTPTWGSSYGEGIAGGAATWMLEDGWFGPNNTESSINPGEGPVQSPVYVNIVSNGYQGSVSLNMEVTQPRGMDTFFLGGNAYATGGNPATSEGENIPLGVALGVATSPLVINHLTPNPGVFVFSANYYYVNENAGYAVVTVDRTEGTAGTVTVKYSTGGGTAVAGRDYTAVNGTLQLQNGISSTNIYVPIINYYTNQSDRVFGVSIFTPSGGATMGTLTNADVEIVNDNISSGFAEFVNGVSATNYIMYYGVNENAGLAQVSVARLGGVSGVLQVTLSTTNGTAFNGTNYTGVTTNLVWQSGSNNIQTVSIPILNSGVVSSNLTVKLKLSNATLGGVQTSNLIGTYTNAVLTITNTDSAGKIQFSSPSYTVNENAGYALIPIVRTGGSAGTNSAVFYTMDGTATNGINYQGTTNTVVFGPGQVNTNFIVAISNLNSSSSLNFYAFLTTNAVVTGVLGSPSEAQVTINGSQSVNEPPGQPDPTYDPLFNGPILALALQTNDELLVGGEFTYADGLPRNYIARMNTDGTLDTTFSSVLATAGASSPVEAIAVEASGLILVGGQFTNFDNSVNNYIARLNLDGSLDTGFSPGTGANNPVYALAQTFVGGQSRLLVGGAFTTFDSSPADGIVQLLDNGSVDTSFNASANATVFAIAVYPTNSSLPGDVLIGGDFTNVDGVAVNYIARLNPDGSVDLDFTNALSSPVAGADGSVHAIAIQLDGRILIGGYFTNVDGVPCNYIARLNPDGTLDTSFTNALANSAIGADGPVDTITLQPDTRIIVGGSFTEFNGVTRNNITRLNPDGTTDPTINFGTGADGSVAASVIENDGNIDLGGGFLNFDSQPHSYLVRVFGGSLAGSGSFQFSAANYQVAQNGIVEPITIVRNGGTSGTNADGSGNVYVTFATGGSSDTATPGVNYTAVSTNVTFPAGEVEETVDIPVQSDPVPTPSSWQLQLNLSNPSPASAVSIIGQNPSYLTILNTSSAISFSSGTYTVANNVPDGEADINVILQGYTNNTSSIVFSTTGGTAVPGVEYEAVYPTNITFNPGVTNIVVQVPIVTDTNYTGSQTVTMALSSPGNAYLYAPSNATLTIVDTANAAGQVLFASSNYTVNESSGAAVVTVLYTNGDLPVTVDYFTVPGTAQQNINYIPVSGSLSFNGSQTAQPISVTLPSYNTPTGPLNFSIVLTNATGGGTIIPPTNTVVTILDDINTGVAFTSGTNAFEETNGVVPVLVQRLGNTNVAFSINYMTVDGSAVEGVNYVTNSGTLNFTNGQTLAAIPMTLINNNDFTNLQFYITLFTNTDTAPVVLASPSNTVVIVEPSATGLSFVSSNTAVFDTVGYVILPVVSTGTNVGPVQVNYSTGGGTATPGVDYTPTSGTLLFTNGQGVNSIEVPILPNTLVQSNQTFNVTLSGPTSPGILVPPSTETVTIVETNTPPGLNFYSPIASNSDWGTITVDDNNPLAALSGNLTWFAWTPTNSGQVEFDTIGSVDDVLGVTNLATVMGVFNGNNYSGGLDTLNWTVVNDGLYENPQQNQTGVHIFSLNDSNSPPVNESFSGNFYQPFASPSPAGPSEVRFNAVAGQTYYIAVETYSGLLSEVESGNGISGGVSENLVFSPPAGLVNLNWAFHPSGVFRFASEYSDETGLTYSNGIPMLLYNVAETEASRFPAESTEGLTYNIGQMNSTIYGTTSFTNGNVSYNFDIPGLQVTVTRVAGSTGEAHVGYTTENIPSDSNLMGTNGYLLNGDAPAQSNVDYVPVSGTLTFADSEMSKTIFIPIKAEGGFHRNRDFLIILTNATLDSAESPDVEPPRLDPTFSTTLVRVLDTDIDPKGPSESTIYVTNTIPFVSTNITTNVVWNIEPTNGVFNFEKAHYQITRDASEFWGSQNITVLVNRSGTNTSDAPTLTWKVDSGYLDDANVGNNTEFPLQPASDYATPTPPNSSFVNGLFPDFDFTVSGGNSGTITPLTGSKAYNPIPISFTIDDNGLQQFNEDFVISLYETDPTTGNPIPAGMVDQTTVTILFNDNRPPAGSVDEVYNADFSYDMVGSIQTTPPNMSHPGTDPGGEVEGLAIQPDNKSIIVGQFNSYDGYQNINNIARLNTDGTLDTSFNPGSGPSGGTNSFVNCIELTTNYESVIGGAFNTYGGAEQGYGYGYGIALVTTNGTPDTTFRPGIGFNGSVYALAFQTNGEILVGGDFTSFNGAPCDYVALVNLNGTLDTSFNPGTNLNAAVYAIAVETNGQVVVGGDFTAAGGISGQNYIARLNPDGSFDPSFDPGSGANNAVFALGLQPDGNIVVGGEFSTMNGQTANNIARLNPNGFIDPNFNSGVGADGPVNSINIATNTVYWTTNSSVAETTNFTIYVGGSFTSINGTHRLGLARLNSDGSVDTTFLDTAYNEFAGLPRDHYSDPRGTVLASGVQSDGNVMIGGSFERVGGGQSDDLDVRPEIVDSNNVLVAETNPGFSGIYPLVQKTRSGVRNRSNVARLIGGATPGPGNIGLNQNSYSIDKSSSPENVGLIRTNGCLGPASVNFAVLPGLAQSGVDYEYNGASPIYWIGWEEGDTPMPRMHSDGFFGTNGYVYDVYGDYHKGIDPYILGTVQVDIFDNTNNFSNLSAQFQLSDPIDADQFYLGGQDIPLGVALGKSAAPFTLIDDHAVAGTFGFTSSSYIATNQSAVISISRANGNSGQVYLSYATTTNGSTAILNSDYQAASGTLTFYPGDTIHTFDVPILYTNSISSTEKTVNLTLFGLNPPANTVASWGISNAVLYIINPNFQGFLSLSTNTYVGNLSAGSAVITVNRTVGSLGALNVQLATADGTAVAGTDYVGVTTNLQWNSGDVSPRTVVVPFLPNYTVGSNKKFYVSLSNPTLNGNSAPLLFATNSITNAVVLFNNNNSYGTFEFSQPTYIVNENGGTATLTVIRTGGTNGAASVQYATADGTAVAGVNYFTNSGTLAFTPGQLAATFTVAITNQGTSEPSPGGFYFTASLSCTNSSLIGLPSTAEIQIVSSADYNQPPGSPDTSFNLGAGMNGNVSTLALQANGQILAGGNFSTVDGVPESNLARLNTDGSLDRSGFLYGLSGPNGPIYSVAVQTDNQILVGGYFTNFNGTIINNIARLNTDGSLDSSFNIGPGGDGTVYNVAEAFLGGVRKIYVGGAFANMSGQASPFIARLNEDGTADPGFAVGSGPNATVYAIAVYPTNSVFAGDVLIGGAFTNFNGFAVGGIARLNSTGALDTNFNLNLGMGVQGVVQTIAIQSDDRVLIGGEFTNVDGVPLNNIARLNDDGSLDSGFTTNVGIGVSGSVNAIALQADNGIVVAGQFAQANGVARNDITRLLPTGAMDPTINFGYGANGAVSAAVIQPANQFIVIGGSFTEYDNQPAGHVARIYGGSVVGSGSFEFASENYQVVENGIVAPIAILRAGGASGTNSDGSGNVSVNFATVANGSTAVAGVNYTPVSTNVIFPPGVFLETVNVPVLSNTLTAPIQWTLNLGLSNPTPPASIVNSNATLTILNDNSFVSFGSPGYSVPKDILTGLATIDVVRQGSSGAPCSVNFITTTNGTAVPGVDFNPTNVTVNFGEGQTNAMVSVQILNNNDSGPSPTIVFALTNAVNTLLTAPTNTTLTIINTSTGPGQLYFASTNYTVNESGLSAVVTVLRTNGYGGSVSVDYATADGTALQGINYQNSSGTLTLGDGVLSGTITVPLLENNPPEIPVSFSVLLSNPSGGATLIAPASTMVTIIDDVNTGVAFLNTTNYFEETNGVVSVQVERLGNTATNFSVSYATINGTAVAGVNYLTNSGTLNFATNQTLAGISVTLINNQDVSNLMFGMTLSQPNDGVQLLSPSNTVVVETPAAAGLSLTSPTNSILKNGISITVPVICLDPSNEPVIINSNSIPLSVNFATANGTAQANVDYYPTNGTLIFTNGIVTNYVTVSIIDNNLITGQRTFSVNLSNPQPVPPARLVSPASQVITIIDNNSGLSFSAPNYSIFSGGLATITVVRVDNTNTTSTVAYSTVGGGSAVPNTDYTPTSGTLTFVPGQTNATFTVNVIGSSTAQPNKTVIIELSNPTPANTVLTAPDVATLTIYNQNGSYIVPAGVALAATNGAPNGILQSNQQVSLFFSFRAAGGLNVSNLMATLLSTANVKPNGTATESYGPLTVNGPSASQEFTLTPVGTNSQTILATFALEAIATNSVTTYETDAFGLTIGSWTTTFSNTNAIMFTNDAIASPYPSIITVSNVGGVLIGATVTLTNFSATSPQAVDVLVVSPAELDTLLMAGVGSANVGANHVTLTFSDTAAFGLPSTNSVTFPITNGVYYPTNYGAFPAFP